ncbi:glycerate kinase [Malaciobacter mytili]|uniref:glycerate kinase n=1 Tax=Malaciobacter mytili TaxID=603050 RepID=UPI00100BC8D6|nr:glycerate kinase [Malaciobacter mytili]RXI46224.1 glycerate kinase [Malaciobacter mytili]
MRILIASDSFKGTLSSKEVALCIEEGLKKILNEAEYEKVILADGGEGTLESVCSILKDCTIFKDEVLNPLGEKIQSQYAFIDEDTALIEMAKSTGLTLVDENKRDILNSTSFGLGQLIAHSVKRGAKKLIIGIGGSATNDAGLGMLQALGVKFFDKHNIDISAQRVLKAKDLALVDSFDISEIRYLRDIKILIASDVSNPLCGKEGATYIFAKQKGATQEQLILLEELITKFAVLCEKRLIKKTKDEAGSGAAGGVGFALHSFLNAKFSSGIDTISSLINLEDKIQKANLVITGEGRVDEQTIYGKTIMGVLKYTKKYDKPCIVIAGSLAKGYEKLYAHGVTAIFDTTFSNNLSFEELKVSSKENLVSTAYNIANILQLKLKD